MLSSLFSRISLRVQPTLPAAKAAARRALRIARTHFTGSSLERSFLQKSGIFCSFCAIFMSSSIFFISYIGIIIIFRESDIESSSSNRSTILIVSTTIAIDDEILANLDELSLRSPEISLYLISTVDSNLLFHLFFYRVQNYYISLNLQKLVYILYILT